MYRYCLHCPLRQRIQRTSDREYTATWQTINLSTVAEQLSKAKAKTNSLRYHMTAYQLNIDITWTACKVRSNAISATVTVKEQVSRFPEVSLTIKVTTEDPKGKFAY